jgi:hypothetical protein
VIHTGPAPIEHYAWIAQRAQVNPGAQFRALEAVDDTGRILAMVGYDGWLTGCVNVHVALDHPAALRYVLRPGFGIPFVELGCRLVLCQVLSTNWASLRLVNHLGFKEVFRGREWWAPGVDLVFFEMRRADCKWIPLEARRWAA